MGNPVPPADEAEQLLRVFQNCPVALAINRWDDRIFVDVNPAFTSLLGWSRQETLGRTAAEVGLVGEAASATIRARLAASGTLHNEELVVHARDGSPRLVLVSMELAELRQARHAITTFVDISDRKRAEAKLGESEARYRALFEYAPDGILIADARSYYVDANASICRMLGYSRAELIGKHASDIVAPSEVAHIQPALGAIATPSGHHREWLFRRKDGTTFPAEVMATQMPDGQLLGMVRDITDRKQLEQQFLRAQRLESIGTLAGGIAHDMNNVLAPILLSLEMLQEQATDEDAHTLLRTLHNSAQRGADLVRQVLSFARGVEGQHVPVNPALLMRDLMTVMRDTFPKSIAVRLTHPELLWTVIGDRTQLHQVFLNLCVNARDAMPDGGVLTITMENVSLDDTYAAMNLDAHPGDYVVVEIADTGYGIPPEIRDRILEPFFTTKEVGKGTGLGLSTALAIVRSHGGFIHLYSETGTGTKFRVYLPADANAQVAPVTQTSPAKLPTGSGELILVVDDEEAIRKVAKRTLEHAGYRVELAKNGAEAVAIYARQSAEIAAVLTDMSMPIMDGPALVVALRAINPDVRVIGSSGRPSSSGLAKTLVPPLTHFVPKPYTAGTLLHAVHEVLNPSA